MSSSAQQPKLESRLEELIFLAEAISEQVNVIDTFQAEYILPAAQHKREQGSVESAEFSPVSATQVTEQVKNLVAQFEENSRQRDELAKLESDLARREEKLKGQRKSLTQRFKAEWAQLQLEKLELESLKSLLGDAEVQVSSPAAETSALNSASGCTLAEVTTKVEELSTHLHESQTEIQRLQSENEELREQLRMRQQKSESPDEAEHIAEIFDLKRRLELTLEELQDAKSELQRLRSVGTVETPVAGGTWEEQKRALLNSLENESNSETAMQQPEAMLESLRQSEELVKQKDATIKQLEALLKEYEEGTNSELHDAEKEAQRKLIDESEVIAIEKERLCELEQQWREKIGEAEIELSKERARLSRERAALDEKLRDFEQNDHQTPENQDSEQPQADQPKKRKWMERLGLA